MYTDKEPVDSWDADDDTLITPEDEEMDVDDEDGEEIALKITKKKPPKVEDTKSKKEHINVVFIGHVGKLMTAQKVIVTKTKKC